MSTAFGFFLRLFLCFVGARFLLQAIDMGGRLPLVGLTLLFLVNVYWFGYLVFRERPAAPVEADREEPLTPQAAASEAEKSPADPAAPEA